MWLHGWFSQSRAVQKRKAAHLHPVSEMWRFYVLVCCFFCSCTVSVTYAFDMFTTSFQNQFGLSDGDLTTVSTVGLVFCYFTIPYSFIYENMGPFLIFLICALCALIGGLCLALTLAGHINGNTATLSVFYAFLNVASGLVDTAYVSTIVELFPRNRGPVIALVKVMTSLGASVLSCINSNFFGSNMTGFIYFLMAFVVFVNVWAAFTVMLPPYFMNWWRRRGKTAEQIFELELTEPYFERKFVPIPRLIIGYVIVVSLIIFFAVEAPVSAYTTVTEGSQIAIGVIAVVLVLLIFLMVLPIPALGGVNEPEPSEKERNAIESEFRAAYARRLHLTAPLSDEPATSAGVKGEKAACAVEELSSDLSPNGDQSYPSADKVQEAVLSSLDAEESPRTEAAESEAEVSEGRQDPRYHGNIVDYLFNVDVWLIMLLFVTYSCSGTLVMYNSSTISIALNGYERSDALSALYTAFLGVGSSVGRIAFGAFEAYIQSQKPGHRKVIITMALPLSPLFSFLGSLFLLVLPAKAILFPYILIYFEEGVFAGVNALIFPCLFENNHNTLYNLSFLVQCITIVCYNRLMFGITIDKNEKKYRREGRIPATAKGCTIADCVRAPLIVAAVLGFCGIFVAIAIHFRYAAFLRREHKAKEEAQQQGIPYVPKDGSCAISRCINARFFKETPKDEEQTDETVQL